MHSTIWTKKCGKWKEHWNKLVFICLLKLLVDCIWVLWVGDSDILVALLQGMMMSELLAQRQVTMTQDEMIATCELITCRQVSMRWGETAASRQNTELALAVHSVKSLSATTQATGYHHCLVTVHFKCIFSRNLGMILRRNYLLAHSKCTFWSFLLWLLLPSVLWRCCLGGRKGIWPVKNWVVGCWHGYLSGARCRLAYGPAMPLPLTVSCFSKIQIGFTFLVLAHLGSPGERAETGVV